MCTVHMYICTYGYCVCVLSHRDKALQIRQDEALELDYSDNQKKALTIMFTQKFPLLVFIIFV